MNRIFSSIVSVIGVWLFLVFFSSQLPGAKPVDSKKFTLNLPPPEEEAARQEKPKPAQASGYTQEQLAAAGQAYLRGGAGAAEGEMPSIHGSADERTYLEFSRLCAKLLVYSPSKGYLGELNASGTLAVLVPMDVALLKTDYPSDGRLVRDPGLVAMASAAAARKGSRGTVRLYMVLKTQQHLYFLGKLVATLENHGLKLKEVASVDVRYTVHGGKAQIVLVSAILRTGQSVKLRELEA